MKIIFTVVLYNNSIADIIPLIESYNQLVKSKPKKNIIISIFDNSEISINKDKIKKLLDPRLYFIFKKANKNLGFGAGHNLAFREVSSKIRIYNNDILIVTNPDIYFEKKEFLKIINFMNLKSNSKIVCCSPLLRNHKNQIQFSAKKNPTILSLLIGRFKVLEKLKFLERYISNNQNRAITKKQLIDCEYLSGCFLIIRAKIFIKIRGFDERYFLHFEDADISRTLNKHGDCIHYPYSTIFHKWNRGSHKSFKQTILLIKSMIKYYQKWGLSIF